MTILSSLFFAAVLFLCAWALVRTMREALRNDGRRAFADGLPFNPAWGRYICEGWLAAFAEDHQRRSRLPQDERLVQDALLQMRREGLI